MTHPTSSASCPRSTSIAPHGHRQLAEGVHTLFRAGPRSLDQPRPECRAWLGRPRIPRLRGRGDAPHPRRSRAGRRDHARHQARSTANRMRFGRAIAGEMLAGCRSASSPKSMRAWCGWSNCASSPASVEETGAVLGITSRSVVRDWRGACSCTPPSAPRVTSPSTRWAELAPLLDRVLDAATADREAPSPPWRSTRTCASACVRWLPDASRILDGDSGRVAHALLDPAPATNGRRQWARTASRLLGEGGSGSLPRRRDVDGYAAGRPRCCAAACAIRSSASASAASVASRPPRTPAHRAPLDGG